MLTVEELEPGLAVELMLTLEQRVVQLIGRTVYSRRVEAGRVEVGVEFVDVPAEDRELLEDLIGGGNWRLRGTTLGDAYGPS